MIHMKKTTALFLSVLMLLAAATGCANSGNGSAGSSAESDSGSTVSADSSIAAPSGSAADTDTDGSSGEPTTLTIWIPDKLRVDYNNNKMTEWLEEQGNFDLQFTAIPSADYETKVNLALTAGDIEDLPDIIMHRDGGNFASSFLMEWAAAGSIIPLTEYYQDPQLASNINEAIQRTGVDYTQQLVMPDGNLYAIGSYNQSSGNEYGTKIHLYKPWLDALGEDIPTTTEELKNLLEKVAATDLNGNSKKDEIPLAGVALSSSGNNWFEMLMNAFVYSGDKYYRTVTDGVVGAAYTTDEWKAGLAYIRGLFEEGLILSETLTMNDEQFKAVANTEDVSLFMFAGATPETVTNMDAREEYVTIKPLTGPNGVQYASFSPSSARNSMIITANCKNPEAAFKLGDLMSCEYIGISQRWGLQGVNWDYAADVPDADQKWESPMDGYDLYIIAYDDNSFWGSTDPTDACWLQYGIYVRQYGISNGKGLAIGSADIVKQNINRAIVDYQTGGYAPAEVIPSNLVYNDEETTVISELQGTLTNYVNEYSSAVFAGSKNLESDWDAFQKELTKIGLDEYLETVQSAYSRVYE